MTIPPPPTEPPTAGMPTPDSDPVVGEWWRKDGPRIPAPGGSNTVYTPVPVSTNTAGPSMEEAAAAFWAPAREIARDLLSEQATSIASQVGAQIGQLLTETEAQRAARQQVEYETLLAAQRARMDSALGKVGETAQEKARRHRVEDILTPTGPSHRDDLVGFADLLAERITETPQDRAARLEAARELGRQRARTREDAARAAAGETPAQRDLRHRQQRLADQREAKQRARRERRRAARASGPSDRTRRFRKWCVLTAISAIGGYSIGLVPLLGTGGPAVGALAAAFGWGFDLHTRDKGRLRVSEVRGSGPLLILILLRVPVASGLVVALGLGPLLPSLHLFN
ncbi:hypothetical protein ACIQC7_27850 [Kitasatospora sp. NPDC088556]|uniref:hypothetical protein n=1 Tax=Kitasatospora sp. NPDC088556 TaxID=3364076 RepID=UPI0037F1123E